MSMTLKVVFAAAAAAVPAVQCWSASRKLSGVPASPLRYAGARRSLALFSSAEDLATEEAEVMAEAEEIAKKKRSNMYNENGVAYAPWMESQVDEEAIQIARAFRAEKKRQERQKIQEKQGVVNILDAATSELSGIGLKATALDETEVELLWGTNEEEDNKGFVVEKKRVGQSEWSEVASYSSWSPLKSKGTLGGAYTYVDVDASEGEWLYRVVAEQIDNTRAITCQVGITVESAGQALQTKIIVGAAGVLFVGFLAAGALLDPIRG